MIPKAEQNDPRLARVSVSRRYFLRGLGTSIALPAFASLQPVRTLAAGVAADSRLAMTAAGAPLRAAFIYFPNGAIPTSWWPKQEGTDVPLSRTLQPLESSKGLVQILGGLNHRTAARRKHAKGTGGALQLLFIIYACLRRYH